MEKWQNIVGYEDLYQISSLGRVKSLMKKSIHNGVFGGIYVKKEKILKVRYNKGYQICDLYKNGEKKVLSLHRLIALAFIPNPENKPYINHINGIKADNRIENLEWVTAKENAQHAIKIGLSEQKGENCYFSKLTDKDVLKIRNSFNEGNKSLKILEMEFGVSGATISRIVRRKIWKHL